MRNQRRAARLVYTRCAVLCLSHFSGRNRRQRCFVRTRNCPGCVFPFSVCGPCSASVFFLSPFVVRVLRVVVGFLFDSALVSVCKYYKGVSIRGCFIGGLACFIVFQRSACLIRRAFFARTWRAGLFYNREVVDKRWQFSRLNGSVWVLVLFGVVIEVLCAWSLLFVARTILYKLRMYHL